MIEINLIPDVKQEFIHAQKMRNMVIVFAILASGAAVALLAVLGLLYASQVLRENMARTEVDKQFKSLQSIDNINNVLTIQNQMSKISSIHANKTKDSRLFRLLSAINPPSPNNVKISKVSLNPADNRLTIEGSAENGFAATDVFRKTILNTKLEYVEDGGIEPLTVNLTEVVKIGETSYGETEEGGRVLRFTVDFEYPKGLFDNTMNLVSIEAPTAKIDVTDSRVRVPDSLFGQRPLDIEEGN
ncbi:hypothetical protein EOL96_03160 [Candidatus Saccharibacteria bacterium]|nr:hypothetical protein [Candidatus Saccharibacteria bacterium]